jgi:hypothetical protein
MQRFKLSRIIWGIGLMLLISAHTGHAQQWSEWQGLDDGQSDLLQYRTMSVVDTTMSEGFTVIYEISNQYSSPVSFTVTFTIPVGEESYTEDYSYRLNPYTSCEGALDTDVIADIVISDLQIHY